jgi:hypothetical protein
MRRALEIVGTGVTLELSKVTAVRLRARMIYFDELPDGTWRLTYNSEMIPDYTVITALTLANLVGKKLRDASVTLEGLGVTLPISKACAIDSPARMIQFDLLRDGTWLMLYSRDLMPDIAQVTALKLIRED